MQRHRKRRNEGAGFDVTQTVTRDRDVTAQNHSVRTDQNQIKNREGGAGAPSAHERGRDCRIDWQVSEALQAWVKEQGLRIDWRAETEQFRDYWRAKPGAAGEARLGCDLAANGCARRRRICRAALPAFVAVRRADAMAAAAGEIQGQRVVAGGVGRAAGRAIVPGAGGVAGAVRVCGGDRMNAITPTAAIGCGGAGDWAGGALSCRRRVPANARAASATRKAREGSDGADPGAVCARADHRALRWRGGRGRRHGPSRGRCVPARSLARARHLRQGRDGAAAAFGGAVAARAVSRQRRDALGDACGWSSSSSGGDPTRASVFERSQAASEAYARFQAAMAAMEWRDVLWRGGCDGAGAEEARGPCGARDCVLGSVAGGVRCGGDRAAFDRLVLVMERVGVWVGRSEGGIRVASA